MADAFLEPTNPNRRLWPDLGLPRVFGTLLLAVLPLVAASALMSILTGTDLSDGEELSGLVFAYLVILVWLGICAGVHLGLIRILGYVTRRQCLIWGLVASLLPGAVYIDTDYFASLDSDQAGFWFDSFQVFGVIGALFFPAGLLSGWIYWRIGIRSGSRAGTRARADPVDRNALTPRHRRWRDLNAGRLCLGLAIAPVLVTILLALFWIFEGTMAGAEITAAAIGVLILAMAFWQMGGWGYLLAVTWPRRRIARFECLLLGLILIELPLPLLVIFVFAIEGEQGVVDLFGGRALSAIFIISVFAAAAVLFAPVGLLTGWLFWRFGVRPAPIPHPDVSAVFD